MHTRVTTLEVPPDRMDDAKRHLQERVLAQLRQMEGFTGFVALGSRQSGKLQGVAFWESEEALRATDATVVPVREGVAEATGGTVVSVEEYEVFVNEAPSAGPSGDGEMATWYRWLWSAGRGAALLAVVGLGVSQHSGGPLFSPFPF